MSRFQQPHEGMKDHSSDNTCTLTYQEDSQPTRRNKQHRNHPTMALPIVATGGRLLPTILITTIPIPRYSELMNLCLSIAAKRIIQSKQNGLICGVTSVVTPLSVQCHRTSPYPSQFFQQR
mmetsp:Transcript_27699/g.58534  ORF Transcript_27699/g.58534 Transcript_27699/m.58534 type:complete len:121 (+) Transcript_27699:155-517(+)